MTIKTGDHGYLLPAVLAPESVKCILLQVPDDDNYIAAVWGAIYDLTRWYNWQRDSAKRGTIAAQRMYDMFDSAWSLWAATEGACMFCCEDTNDLLRALLACCENNTGGTSIAIANYRNVTITTYYSAPTTIHYLAPADSFNSNTGDTPAQAAQRDGALCYAIEVYTNTIINRAARDWAIAAGLIGAVAGFTLPVLGAAIVSVVAGGLLAGFTLDVFQNEDAKKKLRCCMFSALDGLAVTHDNFTAALDSCSFAALTPESQLAGLVAPSLADRGNFLEFVRLLGESMLVPGLESDNCICEEPECGYCAPYVSEYSPGTSIAHVGECWYEIQSWHNLGGNCGGAGCFAAEIVFPDCCFLYEFDWMDNTPSHIANRAHISCGAGNWSYGFDGVGQCCERIFVRVYSDSPVRFRVGPC